MVAPIEERLKFFVFIIESPSAVDLYHGSTEGEMIRQAVGLNAIRSASKIAVNSEAFEAAIRIGLREEMEANPGLVPVLHISAHGDSEGIQLSSGEVLSWNHLRELLVPLNAALNGTLLVCMSTCEGYSGIRMAMTTGQEQPHPYYAIVGNGSKPTWPETAVAFATLYHLLANGHYIGDAVDAMRIASGNKRFLYDTAEGVKKGYLEYLSSVDVESAVEELKEEGHRAENEGELTKLIREDCGAAR